VQLHSQVLVDASTSSDVNDDEKESVTEAIQDLCFIIGLCDWLMTRS
jgi:hypothetical protein